MGRASPTNRMSVLLGVHPHRDATRSLMHAVVLLYHGQERTTMHVQGMIHADGSLVIVPKVRTRKPRAFLDEFLAQHALDIRSRHGVQTDARNLIRALEYTHGRLAVEPIRHELPEIPDFCRLGAKIWPGPDLVEEASPERTVHGHIGDLHVRPPIHRRERV